MRMRLLFRTIPILASLPLIVVAGTWLFSSSPRTNLLLITLDTTRADHIGCYGNPEAATPVLDRLASQGAMFENAYAVCPVTLPSHATMFTGLLPREHGLHHNGIGKLGSQIPTLAELLQSQGYETAGFVGAFVLNRKFGLDRGFHLYDDFTGVEVANGQFHRRRSGQLVVDAALNWLKNRTSRPFFCWIHLFDPHAPYLAREGLFGKQFVKQPYDAGIAVCDRQIGRIIEYLDRLNPNHSTLIVVVGDHGEGLGEHEEREHGHMLYNSTLHVPLMICHPLLCSPGRRVSPAVSLVDLAPTIIDCLRLKRPERLSGRSLAPALKGASLPARPCYAETEIPFLEHGWAPQHSVITENWKFIHSPEPELYDLAQDPLELHNLANQSAEVLREMQSTLVRLQADQQSNQAQNVKLSAAERRALVSLGYLGSGRSEQTDQVADHQQLPDIKHRLKYHEAVEDASHLLDINRPEEAVSIVEKVIAAVPDYFPAQMILGEALAKSGKLHQAFEVFTALAESSPTRGEVHARLASIQGQLGHLEQALAELREAADLGPETAEYRVSLGVIYLELNQQDQAMELFENAIRIDPASANFEIGRFLAAAGDLNGAVKCYKRTLECDSNWIPLLTEIAVLLARQRKFGEAIEYARRAVQMSPRDADAHFNLGRMLLDVGKFKEAQAILAEALRLDPQHPKATGQLQRARAAIQGGNHLTSPE